MNKHLILFASILALASCTRSEIKNRCCENTYEIITDNFEVPEDFSLFIPQAFTPNGDGLNDQFLPRGKGYTVDRLEIRKGLRTVFDSDERLEYFWDGRDERDGIYSYRLWITSGRGSEIEIEGDVCVMRFGDDGETLTELQEIEICDCEVDDMLSDNLGFVNPTRECVLGAGGQN